MQQPKSGRRIVSKGEYAEVQARRGLIWLNPLFMLLVALFAYIVGTRSSSHSQLLMVTACACGVAGLLSIFSAVVISRRIKRVVPLTRANAADLPANDSLVRASQEPAQAQEGVLLRATSGEAQAGKEGQE